MEHLPPITNPHEPISVPYLGGTPYDGLEFASYPTRTGWDIPLLKKGDLQGHSQLEAAQFLQTWVYLGMIYETLKLSEEAPPPLILLSSFIRTDRDTGDRYITTEALDYHLECLSLRLKQLSSPDQKVYYNRFRECMLLSSSMWKHFTEAVDFQQGPSHPQLLFHEISHSIDVLGAALDAGVSKMLGEHADVWSGTSQSKWLYDRMVRQGWCPSVIAYLVQHFYSYASLLGPPKQDVSHSSCSFSDHTCTASNVKSTKEYVRKHVSDDCDCGYINIPSRDDSPLAAAIDRGDIPVIKLIDHGTNIKLEVHSYSESNPVKYTAISHVWADGLGDPDVNRLHICQLKRIGKLINKLPPYSHREEVKYLSTNHTPVTQTEPIDSNCHFWLDTLCVPVTNPHLRNKAIVRMQSVYRCAHNVLVLTTDLISHPSTSFTETFTRISSSAWTRRLWTLQEALLNANLLFQFSDRAVYVGVLSQYSSQQDAAKASRPWDLVSSQCARYMFDYFLVLAAAHPTSPTQKEQVHRIFFIWNNLSSRTTSRGGDEPLCVALLLGLDIAALAQEPHAFSVQRFWRLHEALDCIPACILFIPGRKLSNTPGLSWAPAHVMDLKIVTSSDDHDRPAYVTNRGLRVEFPAFIIPRLNVALESVFPLEIEGLIFYLRAITTNNSPALKDLHPPLHERRNLAVLMIGVYKSDDRTVVGGLEGGLGVIVDDIEPKNKISGGRRTLDGNKEIAGERHVRYLLLVNFIKKGTWLEDNRNIPWTAEELEQMKLPPVQGSYTQTAQKWCIG